MNAGEAIKTLAEKLQSIYDKDEALNIADLVVEAITGLSRPARLHAGHLQVDNEHLLHAYTERLLKHEPVQYVLEKCWFYDMELYVNSSVLIPRPETEELVHWILSDLGKNFGRETLVNKADDNLDCRILDVGTGSGCIALALKKSLPLAEVWGCDLSDAALNVARRNGATLDIRVDFQETDFLDAGRREALPMVHILVSNPPYIPLADKKNMQPNVLEYEPQQALFVADDDPLVFYRALAAFASGMLAGNGKIYMEVHEDQGPAVVQLFQNEGYTSVELKKDMQGKDRMVKAMK